MLTRYFGPARFRSPDDDAGKTGGADDAAAKAAADAAAAKATDDAAAKKAADDAATQKAAEDEAAKKAAEGKEDEMTPAERKLLKESMKRKEKIQEQDSTIQDLSTKLKAWEGLDPAEVRDLLKQRKEAETASLESKGEYEQVKTQMIEAHTKEVEERDSKIAELTEALSKRDSKIADLTVGHAFASSKYITEGLTLPPGKARTLYGNHFEIADDGSVIGYDKPTGAEGRARLVDKDGEPLSFDGALARIVDKDSDRDALVRSKVKPGAGSSTTDDGGGDAGKTEVRGRDRIKGSLESGQLTSGKMLKIA